MYPHGTIANLFDRTRKKLWFIHDLNPGLFDCALCGKPAVAMREKIMHGETDGVLLCRSCFELVIKKAVQPPARIVHEQKRIS